MVERHKRYRRPDAMKPRIVDDTPEATILEIPISGRHVPKKTIILPMPKVHPGILLSPGSEWIHPDSMTDAEKIKMAQDIQQGMQWILSNRRRVKHRPR